MPKITPYTQTQAFQYQPLGLEAFATPLAKMQANIDTARNTLEDTSFNISAMSVDDPRSKELTKDFEGARDELLDNLMKTNNYKQAVSKIKKLNKYYTGNEEISALSSNKKAFDEAKAKSEALVKAGHISEQEHQEWLFRTLGMFDQAGGTAYDPSTGKYNSVNTELRTHNLEKEIMDLSVKLASSAPAQQDVLLSEWAEGVDPTQLESLKATIRAKILTAGQIGTIPHEGIAAELKAALATSKRYKDFLNQEAKYKYYWDKHHRAIPEEFDNEIIDGAVKSLAGLEEETKKQIATATDPNIKKQLEENLDLITSQRDAINNQINTGDIASMAESIFTSDYYDGKIGDWGYDIGNVYDFIENQQVRESREIPGMKDKIKKLEELPKIHTANQQAKGSADERYSITADYGSSNKDHRGIFDGKSMTQWFDQPFSTTSVDGKIVPLGSEFRTGQSYLDNAKNNQGISISAAEEDMKQLQHTTNAYTAMLEEYRRVENNITRQKNLLTEIEKEYNALSAVDKKGDKGREVLGRYNKAKQDLEFDLTEDKTSGELYYIENKMIEFASKNNEFAKLYYQINDPQAVLNDLIKQSLEKEKTFNSEINELQNSEAWQNPGGQDMFYPGVNYDPNTGETTGEEVLMFNVEKYGNPLRWSSREIGMNAYMEKLNLYNKNLEKAKEFMATELGMSEEQIGTSGELSSISVWDRDLKDNVASVNSAAVTAATAEDIKNRKNTAGTVQKYIDEEADLKALFPELIQEIHKDLNQKRNLTANEVILTEDADKWTNGELKKIVKFIEDNPPNTATGYQIYDYDGGSRTAKVNSDIKTTDDANITGHAPELYLELDPAWEGVANIPSQQEDREGQILRMKRAGNDAKFIAIMKKRYEEDNPGMKWDDNMTAAGINNKLKEFKENNPTDIHTAVVGTSFDVNAESLRNYEESLDAAVAIKDTGYINQIIQNTAPIYVNSNMDRAMEYNQTVSKLLSAVQNKTREKVVSYPNYWDIDETNGVIRGNKITYFYDDKQGAIIMEVSQHTYEYKNGKMGDFVSEKTMPQTILSGFDAITLAANDIKFGTGSESDILYSTKSNGTKQIIPAAFRLGN